MREKRIAACLFEVFPDIEWSFGGQKYWSEIMTVVAAWTHVRVGLVVTHTPPAHPPRLTKLKISQW